MWLKLTLHDGSPLRINSDLIEAYQETDENNCQTVLSTNNDSYCVRESLAYIDYEIYGIAEKKTVLGNPPIGGNWK